ncbi:L,D-transpeptidase family protein [Thiorhodococcus mannitoliphagus]|uniref:L,D-transpeptidase family protein n=1 Tax=Thiorhodococcus mannitoliphagus TaxID=329406 RepID=A0A6P1DYH3_9GAMM|nr:L,D-transpeptidase [Thiorhodococcus mannitoliphagus]NEX21766.1 L,D-transpeptidase family protein [Thiorhodococcus mannitoliphagus]
MTHTDNTLSLPLGSLKIALSSLIALSLLGCDGLARFTAKPDKKAEAVVAVEEPAEPAPIPASKEKKPVEKPKKAPLYEWNGDGRSVTRIVINTNEQKARFYADNEEIGWATVATGVSKHPTPTGQFEVMEKVANKRSNLYGKVVKNGKVVKRSVKVGRDSIPAGGTFEGAKMPYFMRLTYDGVGLHAGPIPRPGSPASHGCIRMPSKFAPLAFKHVSEGTSVEIVGKGPSYGDYVAKQRAIAAKRAAERKRVAAAAKQPTKKAATTPVATSVAESTPAAAPAAAAGTVAAAAAVTQTAQAKDSSAATQTLETSPPRETHMRAPAEDSAETSVAAQQSAPTVTQEPAPSAPEPSVETAQAQAPTPAPKAAEPPAAVEADPQPVAAEPLPEPTPPEVAAPKPAKPAEPTQIAAPKPAQEPSAPVVEKPAAAPKPAASVPAAPAPAPAPAASAPPPPAADAG